MLNNLRVFRAKARISQTQLAEAAGVSKMSVFNHENEKTEPDFRAMRGYVDAFKGMGIECTLEDIFPTD